MPSPTRSPPGLAAARPLGRWLEAAGFNEAEITKALGIDGWTGVDLDDLDWRRQVRTKGAPGDRVRALLCGDPLSLDRALVAIPRHAWEAGLITTNHQAREVHALGCLVPMGEDLIWTDRGDRTYRGEDGVFVPDSTSLGIRRCLPPHTVDRHLDIGCGAGAVTVAAARRARETVALDVNHRAGMFCLRTAALSGVEGVTAFAGDLAGAAELGTFDRVSFVMPLLLPWKGMAASPVHTLARAPDLLARTIALLPRLLRPGGLALLYAQAWVGGEPVEDAFARAFGSRAWRTIFWLEHTREADEEEAGLKAGIWAIEADREGGFWETPRLEADEPGVDWWPALKERLEI